MSDLVPASHFDGIVRIVKLINGDELIGIVQDAAIDRIKIILPAKLETAFSKEENGELVEYVKLTNYAVNVMNYEVVINRSSIMYMGMPIPELNKMYDAFFIAMKTDPTSIVTNGHGEIVVGPEAGLQMLNELFNNEDFVNFVNDLIDNFEADGVMNEILDEIEEEEAGAEAEESEPESPLSLPEPKEDPKPSRKKKRRRINPSSSEIPFKPDSDPNSAEGWSDNPMDYF
jgi:hypothetical protein